MGFPAFVTHTVPARWLRPLGERQELHPESEKLHRAEVCRDADGQTPGQIGTAIDRAQENLLRLRGIALDDLNVDFGVPTTEADLREWRRIADYLTRHGQQTYDPRTDPDAVEHPPVIQFRPEP